MKRRVRGSLLSIGLSLLLAIALGINAWILSPVAPAFASDCTSPSDTNGGIPYCANGTGSITPEQPTVHCNVIVTSNGSELSNNIMQGCTGVTGGNYEKRGLANWDGVQEWVSQYGWTYTGTGDGMRYFTYNNYTYFQEMDSSMWVAWSDGKNGGCYGGGSSCDYDAWNNYQNSWTSPSAQLRIWVDGAQRSSPYNNQAYRQLEAPQPGLVGCQGNGTGSASLQDTASISLPNGTLGFSTSLTQTINYSQDGQCNANSDAYSTYMNLNWEGGTISNGTVTYHNTQSALGFFDVTATDGVNQSSNNYFLMDMNLEVNWWDTSLGAIRSYDLFGNWDGMGPTYHAYAHDTWNY